MLTFVFYVVVMLALVCIGCGIEKVFPHAGKGWFGSLPEDVPTTKPEGFGVNGKPARNASEDEARDLQSTGLLLHIADDEYASESTRQKARAAIAKNRMATSPANLRVVPYVREAQVQAGLERLLAEIDGDQGGAA